MKALRTTAGLVTGVAILLTTTLCLPNVANAQDVKSTDDSDDSDGYGYEFGDDPLTAGGFGPNDATIRVRPGPVRRTLIRPRTSFVPEMLKSVENL